MRLVTWLEALRRSPRRRGAAAGVLAVAVSLSGALFAFRLDVTHPSGAALVLLCVPVAVVAVAFGRWAGLAAAAAAIGLVALWDVAGGDPGGVTGYASRGVAYLLLGLGLGWFADLLMEALRAQHTETARAQRAEHELEEAQRVADIGSWVWDPRTDVRTWSPQMFRIFEIDRADVAPGAFPAALAARAHPDDVATAAAARERALRDHEPFEFQQRLVMPDGQIREVFNRGEVVVDDDGVVTALRGTTQDVTRLRAAERAAQTASERLTAVLNTMLDAVTVGVAVRDVEGQIVDFRVLFTNEVSRQVYGKPVEEIVDRLWSQIWPERFDTELFERYVHMVETGEPFELTGYEYKMPSPDGPRVRVVDVRGARFGDGYVAAWRDVTHRAEAAREREVAAAKFAAAFNAAPVGMALLDERYVVVRANATLAAITATALDRLIGRGLDDILDPRDRAATRTELDRLVAGVTPIVHREVRLVDVDGGSRWVALSAGRIAAGRDEEVLVVHLEDIHERKAYESRLQYLADHDPLTGLFNRRRFHEELAHQVAVDERYGKSSMVALVDLDNFKYINDTLGHAVGDRLIQAVARAVLHRSRDSDIVGRLGGDEFAVLLPGADADDAAKVGAALLEAIRTSATRSDGQIVRSTGSIGFASTDPEGNGDSDADSVLANADLAMYAAKDAGRDTFVVFDSASGYAERSRARFRWLDRVRRALDEDLFVLLAQPILDLDSGSITGAELLLRMRDNGDRLIPPERFLYIAERHGLATAIDRLVIARGIALAASLDRPPGFRWEINLSADSLADPEIPTLIATELERTGLPPSALVFEITETAAITNMDQARTFATRITDIGCRFALDDFGAGYGSFYYLKHLPFDYLKIDGEFVRQLTTSTTDHVIVQAIVTAAHRLGKQTIAEYVGDARTLSLLRAMHVDFAQGYHVGHPADPEFMPVPEQRMS